MGDNCGKLSKVSPPPVSHCGVRVMKYYGVTMGEGGLLVMKRVEGSLCVQ